METLAKDGGRPVRTRPWVSEFQGAEAVGEEEIRRVVNVLQKKRVFRYLAAGSEASEAFQLEEEYKDLTGCRFALAVNSGTSALIAALVGLGVGPGDEVIMPAFAWVATVSAILEVNAIPILCEIDSSLTLDPDDLQKKITSRTKAIIVVHMRGIAADLDRISALADRHGIMILEDAAQANGGTYNGRRLGSLGAAGCFSLQQYKVVSAGEGGMIVTDDELVWQRAALYHDCGRNPFQFTERKIPAFAGQNYRITELQAALCLGQMDKMEKITSRMRQIKNDIAQRLQSVPGIEQSSVFGTERDLGVSAVFYLPKPQLAVEFQKALDAEGIPCEVLYRPDQENFHIYAYWDFLLAKRDAWGKSHPWSVTPAARDIEYSYAMCPQSLALLGRAIQIRLNQYLTDTDIDDLINAVGKVAENLLA